MANNKRKSPRGNGQGASLNRTNLNTDASAQFGGTAPSSAVYSAAFSPTTMPHSSGGVGRWIVPSLVALLVGAMPLAYQHYYLSRQEKDPLTLSSQELSRISQQVTSSLKPDTENTKAKLSDLQEKIESLRIIVEKIEKSQQLPIQKHVEIPPSPAKKSSKVKK